MHAVTAGAAFLDARVPDWYLYVDIERLDICDTQDCVLGQLYGEFCTGLDDLQISDARALGLSHQRVAVLGELTAYWRLAIRARLAVHAALEAA